ncbi:hypothetical protein F511_45624 [Dorcoceras hygrometricum]|uniref:Uncharacterized protein n=1 Tax=Dorcoceras hygrometricum TaxID=472368 RepID=A0A2Z7A2P1_9LAMI|nr:hypothetical protein F511_45624 [Dorcoceras hygrometricum]
MAGIMQQNLHHRKFKESIAGKPSADLEELLQKYICIEESTKPRYLAKSKRYDEKVEHQEREERRGPQAPRPEGTPLNATLADILIVAEKQGLLRPPRPMQESAKRQSSDKYCKFHKDKGHTTETVTACEQR